MDPRLSLAKEGALHLVLRAAVVYCVLLIVFRVAGRRTMAKLTSFDFVLLLIISESTQQALLGGEDFSLTGAFLVILTLVMLDVALSLVKRRWPKVTRWIDGAPLVLIEHGEMRKDLMYNSRVSREDILTTARETHGTGTMAEIDSAILEASGEISILPSNRTKD